MEQRDLRMSVFPVTVYKDDPATNPLAEWNEIWTAQNPSSGEWILCIRHGWWDTPNNRAHFNVPTLSEPFKTEAQVEAAMDSHIATLEAEGWIHKFTTVFDPTTGGGKGVRI
jgi:hypothetical protein